MSITALPEPPSRADPANFAARGDAFMAALPQFVTEANALAAAMGIAAPPGPAAFTAIDATSLDVVNGKAVHLLADANFSYVANSASVNSEYLLFDIVAHTMTVGTTNVARAVFGETGVAVTGQISATSRLSTDTYLQIKDAIAEPGFLTGYAILYVDSADGDLKVKFGDGTVKTLATDT